MSAPRTSRPSKHHGSTTPAAFGHPIPIDVAKLIDAARLDINPKLQQRAPRYGRIGACYACRQPIHVHFDAAGHFLGCPAATEDTIFVLMPISESATQRPNRLREFIRARYVPTIPRDTRLDELRLTDRYRKALEPIVKAGDAGIIGKDVERRSGLSKGSASQALCWLRDQGFIDAHEDYTDTE